MRFQTTLIQNGKTTTGLQVPPEIIERLGAGKGPAVSVTLRGHAYRSTIAPMSGVYMLPVSAEIRRITGVAGGETGTHDHHRLRAFRGCDLATLKHIKTECSS